MCSASVSKMLMLVGDCASCSASKVLGKKPAKQRFGWLSTTKELYGIVHKPEDTGRSVKYVVYFSEVEVAKAFSSRSLKHQATATNEANSTSDAHIPPSISVVEHSTTLPGKPSNKWRWREMLDEDGGEVGQTEVYNKTLKWMKVVESHFDAASIIDVSRRLSIGNSLANPV